MTEVIALVLAVFASIAAAELGHWMPRLSLWLVRHSSAKLPAPLSVRMREEWSAHVGGLPGPLAKLIFSLDLLRAARRINRDQQRAATAKSTKPELGVALSRPGRVYVLAVAGIGGGLVLSSMGQILLEATTPYWLILTGLTLLSAPLSLRFPGLRATLTVSETFVFAAALLFGPAPATVIVALHGVFVAMWAKRHNMHRTLFNIGEPAIAVWLSAQLFYEVSGVTPLFGAPVGLGQLIVPLLLMTTTYFVLNCLLSLTATWFETSASPLSLLRGQLMHTGLNYFASCSCVVLLVLNLHDLTVASIGMFVPLVVLSYASFKLSTDRVEEANTHLNELSQLYLSTIEALVLAIDAKD